MSKPQTPYKSLQHYNESTIEDPKRPFRLWDAVTNKHLPWRCFSNQRNAHMGALFECAWRPNGAVLEVYDTTNGTLLGQYFRDGEVVKFWRSKLANEAIGGSA